METRRTACLECLQSKPAGNPRLRLFLPPSALYHVLVDTHWDARHQHISLLRFKHVHLQYIRQITI